MHMYMSDVGLSEYGCGVASRAGPAAGSASASAAVAGAVLFPSSSVGLHHAQSISMTYACIGIASACHLNFTFTLITMITVTVSESILHPAQCNLACLQAVDPGSA